MDAMKLALANERCNFSVFGGEPLLTPIEDLEELWRWGMELFGQNGIQTSAVLVTERHFGLFRKYNVSVGISLEGPAELNDIRWAGSLERTREMTERAHAVLYRLLEERQSVSLITTLNRGNASPEQLSQLLDWYRDLDGRGLRHVNLHLMEVDDEQARKDWSLSEDENAEALLACADFQPWLKQLRFQPITDMVQLLLDENSQAICTWNACDPYTTRAVRAIGGHGELLNCSRVNKAGVDMQKADRELLVRPLALYHIAQKHGGCQDCRFWHACKGSCPGQSDDWRRKSEHCETLRLVFAELERRLSSLGYRPISSDEDRRKVEEARMIKAFRSGKLRLGEHGDRGHGDVAHADHVDVANPIVTHCDSWGKGS